MSNTMNDQKVPIPHDSIDGCFERIENEFTDIYNYLDPHFYTNPDRFAEAMFVSNDYNEIMVKIREFKKLIKEL